MYNILLTSIIKHYDNKKNNNKMATKQFNVNYKTKLIKVGYSEKINRI